jgi:hypothetical protein
MQVCRTYLSNYLHLQELGCVYGLLNLNYIRIMMIDNSLMPSGMADPKDFQAGFRQRRKTQSLLD